jgi:hypothetical protein
MAAAIGASTVAEIERRWSRLHRDGNRGRGSVGAVSNDFTKVDRDECKGLKFSWNFPMKTIKYCLCLVKPNKSLWAHPD